MQQQNAKTSPEETSPPSSDETALDLGMIFATIGEYEIKLRMMGRDLAQAEAKIAQLEAQLAEK